MKKYEYYRTTYTANDLKNNVEISQALDKWGEDSWELVSVCQNYFINDPSTVCSYNFYFKRELKQN